MIVMKNFFGQPCDVSSILNGSVKAPFNEDFATLCKKLDQALNPGSITTSIDDKNLSKDENHPILNISSNPKTD